MDEHDHAKSRQWDGESLGKGHVTCSMTFGNGKGRLRDKGLQFHGVLVAEMGEKFVRVMSDPAASITMPILVGAIKADRVGQLAHPRF